ncbi:MAG: SDR family oxidoreductase [Gemmatimonadota bacterium]
MRAPRPEREEDGVSGASLAGRAVVVTGASGGIGRACAAELVARGAVVTLVARGAPALEALAAELAMDPGAPAADPGQSAAEPGERAADSRERAADSRERAADVPPAAERVLVHAADVAAPGAMDAAVAATRARFGRLDGLVHAAAIIGPIGPALEVDPAAWLEAVRVDLHGTFLAARAAAAGMDAAGGSIVLFSGGGGTSPFPNYTAYAAAKAGVVRLAETLAMEWAPRGIRVNSLAPGFVATAMHQATLQAGERAGAAYLERTRAELAAGGVPPVLAAQAAAFLLSDEAAGITGRLLAAPWDAWADWPSHADRIAGSDLFTLRRIVPRDRGQDWQ